MSEENWRSLAERTANKIRLLQADLSEEDASSRREHIADEIRAALEKVVPQERDQFLALIEERFPAWEGEGLGGGQRMQAAPAAVAPTDMAEFNDAGFLLRQLSKLAGSMTPAQRVSAAEMLAKSGITTGGASGVSSETMDRLRATLQVAPGSAVDFERLVSTMAQLLEKVISLDEIAIRNWRQISQSGRSRGKSVMAGLLGQYFTGDQTVGSSQVSDELESFRRLSASLMLALSQTGQAAFQQMRKYHPDEVEGVIRTEGAKVLVSHEVRCWRRFKELAEAMDAAQVEQEVLRSLAGFVNDWMSRQSR